MSKKEKIKEKLKLALITGIPITLLWGGINLGINHTKEENELVETEKVSAIGYKGLNFFNQLTGNHKNKTFSLIDIKDHDSLGLYLRQLQLDYCTNNNIGIGLIVTTDSTTELDFYLDLEYLLGILEKYEVKYPIYLNLDNIMKNETINLETSNRIC